MTNRIHAFSVSSPSTTASGLPDSERRKLAAVPETRGRPVVVLEPITVETAVPAEFADIDTLVDQAEADAATKQAIATGRKSVAQNYYATQPRSLSYYRLCNGWSQKELAGYMGTSQSYIARLEAGDIDPQVSTVKRLAAVFKVPPADVIDALNSGASN